MEFEDIMILPIFLCENFPIIQQFPSTSFACAKTWPVAEKCQSDEARGAVLAGFPGIGVVTR